ncbi:HNH endonuclease signature motif containing protein [Streptomyces sp. NPDC051315]|uniref:HNH endonuclease signature motif containing protein n=1 Tax=Streptomyces sp. NPDC051315 TaxID=3365650 RepID=UPI00379665C8
MKTGQRLCSITGCTRRVHARNWCGTHYQRWKTTGSVELKPRVKATCAAVDCDKPVYSSGLCTAHYRRVQRKGYLDLEPVLSVRERLQAGHVKRGGCWIWQGRTGKNGYGRISLNDTLHYAHRVAYETFVGPIAADLTIDHLCRVPMCINPAHLEPVTRAENTRRENAARSSK